MEDRILDDVYHVLDDIEWRNITRIVLKIYQVFNHGYQLSQISQALRVLIRQGYIERHVRADCVGKKKIPLKALSFRRTGKPRGSPKKIINNRFFTQP